jgi:hypothetical protein
MTSPRNPSRLSHLRSPSRTESDSSSAHDAQGTDRQIVSGPPQCVPSSLAPTDEEMQVKQYVNKNHQSGDFSFSNCVCSLLAIRFQHSSRFCESLSICRKIKFSVRCSCFKRLNRYLLLAKQSGSIDQLLSRGGKFENSSCHCVGHDCSRSACYQTWTAVAPNHVRIGRGIRRDIRSPTLLCQPVASQ